MRLEPTEPRNTESLCASCEHLGLNGYYPSLHCYMRDIDIYKGFTKCKDYKQNQVQRKAEKESRDSGEHGNNSTKLQGGEE